MTKTTKYTGHIASIAMLASIFSVRAATQDVEPSEWEQEEARGFVTVTVEESDAVVSFGAQSGPPAPTRVRVLADGIESDLFGGDYIAANVRGVRFTVEGDGYKPGVGSVVLTGASGRKWYNDSVNIVTQNNVAVENYVPFDLDKGWKTFASGDKAVMWDEDLSHVTSLGLLFSQASLAEQNYRIADFSLMGPLFDTRSEVAKKIRAHFGVDSVDQLDAVQLKLDSDKDGMSDLQELLAGTDPNDVGSVFAAGLARVSAPNDEGSLSAGALDSGPEEDEGIVVRWPCLKWEKYTVYRSTDITEGFSTLKAGIEAQEDGYMQYVDNTARGKGPYFYRVKKEK